MSNVRNYRDLIVWQKGMDLADHVYSLSRRFPREEVYGLTSQIRRCAVSIPSNIAEGHARQSTAEYRNFISIAQGSLAELETQLLLAIRFTYLSEADTNSTLSLATEVSKMLRSLRQKLVPTP
jgi:four helix bundle protein